ncbi:periplasmic binding protein-like I [Chytriomyces cf. hyalinus JEL632]|nr:periplasmic binding protein-like I [Chytriomyces cf. hyalinus JEL632]
MAVTRGPGTTVTNITIGLIANYCAIPFMTFNQSYASNFTSAYDPNTININGNSGWSYYSDLAVAAAIENANREQILLGVYVNLKRFSDCGEYYVDADWSYMGNSAGYAAAVTAVDIVDVHTDVIGVIGNQFSSAAKGTAQILSNYQIPYCSGSIASPRYSDKAKYPYFWRTFPNTYTKNLKLLLTTWKVKRVSIIYESDEEIGLSSWFEMTKAFRKTDIQVISDIPLKGEFGADGETLMRETLRLTDSRYMVVFGQSSFVGRVLKCAGESGLYGSKYVWISANGPIFDQNAESLPVLKGVIIASPCDLPTASSAKLRAQVDTVAGFDFEQFYFDAYGLASYYDCVMLMLLGFRKLNASPESLSKRLLQAQMNFTLFEDLGYDGALTDSIILDANGDMELPFCFARLSGSYLNVSIFAMSGKEAQDFADYQTTAPIFYDDSSNPPRDGPPSVPIQFNGMNDRDRIVLIRLSVTGIVLSLCCIVFTVLLRGKNRVKAGAPVELGIISIGCCVMYASLMLYIQSLDPLLCRLKVGVTGAAAMLILVPLVGKNSIKVWLFRQKVIQKNVASIMAHQRWVQVGVMVVGVGLALAKAAAGGDAVQVLSDFDGKYLRCVEPMKVSVASRAVTGVYFGFFAVLWFMLPVLAFMSAHIRSTEHNETTPLVLTAVTTLGGYCLTQAMMASSSRDSDFKIGLLVWTVTTVNLQVIVGMRVYTVLKEMAMKRYGMLGIPSSSRGNASSSATVSGRAASPVLAVQGVYNCWILGNVSVLFFCWGYVLVGIHGPMLFFWGR